MEEEMNTSLANHHDHRGPLPKLPWIMKQTWRHTLFAHYPVKREILRKLVPASLPLDSYQDTCWVSVVPYITTSMHLRLLPPIPGTSTFAGFNVRTYVTLNGKPGVYFFSLTAANWLAANSAKAFFQLPYHHMEMKLKEGDEYVTFESRKREGLQLVCDYKPISEPYYPKEGSLDAWLVERYCFYNISKIGIPIRCDILHQPWELQKAEAVFHKNTSLSKYEITPENKEPILHYAKERVVSIWPIVPVKNSRG
ncbi:uncharacterized protein YqjF (DUF2071 family) [Lysinibacillus composti]|uniref:DUF2071 domain-containing protein n=1 Tax=Lysinibacillus composti TaxID=720633 RepID=A0A3N9UI09_9BACI|nr:DUF2071 domain-containing protein [Lysinibacillus composti]MBM7609610.1 uncharacterized protein YqjF (DUF2071 family) [Lysinibacillus composti]RQW75677.1 DUF2071 domain-containing protein [Lysinibacillus composti]